MIDDTVTDDPVVVEVEGGVATISLNRPDRHNALDELADGLLFRYLDLFRADRDVRVVVLRGNGESFSSGREHGDTDDNGDRPTGISPFELLDREQWNTRLLYDYPVPIICALKGWVLGGAFERALLCDLRVAAESTKMSLSAIDHGLAGNAAGVAKLHEIGGSGLALDLALTGRRLNATDAHRLGLVSRVVPDDELDEVVAGIAQAIADRPPLAVRLIRDQVQALSSPAVAATLSRELVSHALLTSSHDHTERRLARAEDRQPRYERR